MSKKFGVIIEGDTLEELKSNVADIVFELCENYNGGETIQGLKDVTQLNGIDKTSLAPVQPLPEVVAPVEPSLPPIAGIAVPQGEALAVELDAEGIPWDKRIHSGGKTQMKNTGVWKTKKGVDPAVAAQVKAELLNGATVAAPLAPVTALTPVVVPAALAPVVAAPAVPAVQVGLVHDVSTFSAQFEMIVGNLITTKKIDQTYVNELKAYFQVAQIWDVSAEQKVQLFETFVGAGLIQQVG